MTLHGSRLRFAWLTVAGAAVGAAGRLSLLGHARPPAGPPAGRTPAAGAGAPPNGGLFRPPAVQPAKPVVRGLQALAAWEEPVADAASVPAGRTVIMERVDAEGRQPWPWVKTQGKGRVFYTGYGHGERTWSNAGFQSLVERGIVW